MNETNVPDDGPMLPEEEAAYLLWQIFGPILLVFGSVGNVLTIIVLTRKSMRTFRMSIYLVCLAVADLLALCTSLLQQWLTYMFDIDVINSNEVLCKMTPWFGYFILDMSNWILVSVTVERVISVWKPLHVNFICTRWVITVNIIAITIMLMLVNGHFLFGRTFMSEDGEPAQCANMSVEYAQFLEYYFPWIDLFFFSLGPFAFQIVCNILIIIRLRHSSRGITNMILSPEQRADRERQVSTMTRMLLVLNFMYIVLTLPVSVYLIYSIYWETGQTSEGRAQQTLTFACVNVLMYLNNSINFITYMAKWKRFRTNLIRLFRRKRNNVHSNTTQNSNQERSSFTISTHL